MGGVGQRFGIGVWIWGGVRWRYVDAVHDTRDR